MPNNKRGKEKKRTEKKKEKEDAKKSVQEQNDEEKEKEKKIIEKRKNEDARRKWEIVVKPLPDGYDLLSSSYEIGLRATLEKMRQWWGEDIRKGIFEFAIIGEDGEVLELLYLGETSQEQPSALLHAIRTYTSISSHIYNKIAEKLAAGESISARIFPCDGETTPKDKKNEHFRHYTYAWCPRNDNRNA